MLTGVDAIQDGAKYVVGDQYTIAGSHVHAVKDRVEPVSAEGNSPCYFSSFWYGYMLTLDFFHHSSPIAIVHPSLSSPDTKHRSHCFTLLSLGVRVLLPHLGESRGLFAIARTASCPTEASTTGSTIDLTSSASGKGRQPTFDVSSDKITAFRAR